MRPLRPFLLSLPLLVVASACREGTSPTSAGPPGVVTWLEWPGAVTGSAPESLLISVYHLCGWRMTYGVKVEGTDLHVAADVRVDPNVVCLQSAGTGAGHDTVLALPALRRPALYNLWAPIPEPSQEGLGIRPADRLVGAIAVGLYHADLNAPDTSKRFAGLVSLMLDSLGCWRGRPWSAPPIPQWPFAQTLALTPRSSGRTALLIGRFVGVSPAACGDAWGIDAETLEVDATP